jgi:signal transduction histidine kinase
LASTKPWRGNRSLDGCRTGRRHTTASQLAARAESIADLAQKTITTVQRISEELRPGVLDQLGLEAALSGLLADVERRTGISTTCRSTLGERRLDPHVETNVFRIAQELVTTVVRHAGARSLVLEIGVDDGALRMRVADDGRGITADELVAARSIGLVGLRERAILLGGSATLRPLPGGGTEAVVVAPAEVRA